MPSQAVLELLVQLRDEASSGLSSLGGAMGNVGMIAGGAAVAGVVALGGAIIAGMGDAQEARAIFAETEQIIKNTGGSAGVTAQQVVDLASALSDAAGKSLFGDDQIQGAENVILKFKELKVPIADVTQLSLDMAQTLGTAPADAAKTLGLALQNPFEAAAKLAKQGIVLSESQTATLEAFKANGDAAGAQALLMDALNATYGGQAEAAAKAAGGMVQFKAGLGETFETIGGKLLPVLDKFGAWLNSPEVQANISIFADRLGRGIEIAADFLVNDLIPAITDLYNFLAPILGPIIAEVARALSEDLPRGIERVVTGWNTMKQALSDFKTGYLDPIARGWEVISTAVSGAFTWMDKISASINSVQIPSWLQGHSPPPMAEWFDSIGLSAKSSGGALADFIAQMQGGTLGDMSALFDGDAAKHMKGFVAGLLDLKNTSNGINQTSVLDMLGNSLGGGNVQGDTLDRIAAMAFDQEANAGGAGGQLAEMIHQLLLAQQQGNTGMVDQISAALNASVAGLPAPAMSTPGSSGAGGAVNVYVTVQGNVSTERDLVLAIRDGLNAIGRQNVTIFAGQT